MHFDTENDGYENRNSGRNLRLFPKQMGEKRKGEKESLLDS